MRSPKLCPGLVRNHAAIPALNVTYETYLAEIRIAYFTRWRARLHGATGGFSHGEWLITSAPTRPRFQTALVGDVSWRALRPRGDTLGHTK